MEDQSNSDTVKKMITTQTGEEPQIDEPTCVLWRADHSICTGCPSDLPCSKLAAILLIYLKGTMYTPSSFDDFLEMTKRIGELTDKILKASTIDEVKSYV